MQISDGKNQMRDRGCVSNTSDIEGAGDWLHADLVVKVAGFDAEGMTGKFPKIKTYADYYRKLGMDAGKIARDDRVEGSHNSQLAAVFLGKIAKGKKFDFHFGSLRNKYFIYCFNLSISPF